jgi:hypothetical protein
MSRFEAEAAQGPEAIQARLDEACGQAWVTPGNKPLIPLTHVHIQIRLCRGANAKTRCRIIMSLGGRPGSQRLIWVYESQYRQKFGDWL